MRKLLSFSLAFFCLGAVPMKAAPARITHLRQEVKILRPPGAPRSVSLNETITDGASLQTGANSQAELRFENGTLVRLAARTELRLENGPKKMQLLRGAILVRSPRNAGEARVAAGPVVSEANGTTSVLEFYPKAYTKLIVLDGTARMFLPAVVGESVLVDPGQLLMFQAKVLTTSLPNPVDLDLQRMMATSALIRGFPPLESATAIAQGMQEQKKKKTDGALAETNLVIFGRGTLVSLLPPSAASPTPTPKASKSVAPKR